ncbi:MAG: nucleotidyltransferase family protein [Candidatus Omnitrophota bacterium]|nr:nucleotidyltransferase family protein [Candidatus Omnitrophota bacterium]
MKALILAAGYGTRLYPYVKNYPKPLLKVNNRPIVDYLLDKLKNVEGLSDISVVTNALYFGYFDKWKEKSSLKSKIHIINDHTHSSKDKLGAIRDMNLVFKKEGLSEDYLVLGGDNFFEEPLTDFVKFARKRKPAVTVGLYDLKSKSEATHYGVVSVDRNNKVKEFLEKPARPKSSRIATCVYYFPRSKLKLVEKYLDSGKEFFDNIGAYIRWLVENDLVYGYIFKKLWVDIGRIETYRKLNAMLKGES